MEDSSRRLFLKKSVIASSAIAIGGAGMSAKSYGSILGSNEKLNVALFGLGRRMGAFTAPIMNKSNNVNLSYICDVMQSQIDKAAPKWEKGLGYMPKTENNFFRVLEDKNVDAVINAMPDHWHAPGTWLAVEAGKHGYVEKPCSHNPREGEALIAYKNRYNKIIQMGNQQRSSSVSNYIINEIHNGIIGVPYKAKAFYNNGRPECPVQKPAAVPAGFDWDMWQGPAPRRAYTDNTWDYNWHWYGWDHGTAETGNNATHELDVARWALQVDFPERVMVEAEKRHFANDGWEMYDTMDAKFIFEGKKSITWDGKSRNNHKSYGGSGRGTIIYGTEGTVWLDRSYCEIFDRGGKLIKRIDGNSSEAGTALGGGGEMSTSHVENFFDAIRGKAEANSPIEEGHKSVMLCHLANIAYRSGSDLLECDPKDGKIKNRKIYKKYWGREYEKGWEPKM